MAKPMASQSSIEPLPALIGEVEAAAAQFVPAVTSTVTSTNLLKLRSGKADLGYMATFFKLKAGNTQSLGGVIVNTAYPGEFPSLISCLTGKTR